MYEIFPQTKVSTGSRNVVLKFDGVNTSKLSMAEARRLCDSSCQCMGFNTTTNTLLTIGENAFQPHKQTYTFYSNIDETEFIDGQSTLFIKTKNKNFILFFGVLFTMLLSYIWWCMHS